MNPYRDKCANCDSLEKELSSAKDQLEGEKKVSSQFLKELNQAKNSNRILTLKNTGIVFSKLLLILITVILICWSGTLIVACAVKPKPEKPCTEYVSIINSEKHSHTCPGGKLITEKLTKENECKSEILIHCACENKK